MESLFATDYHYTHTHTKFGALFERGGGGGISFSVHHFVALVPATLFLQRRRVAKVTLFFFSTLHSNGQIILSRATPGNTTSSY